MPKYGHVAERIRANVAIEPAGDCWIWQRRLNRGGYGRMNFGTRAERVTMSAHRVSYETFVGPIPEGLDLDHLCRNRACVNPEHLEPVTRQENLRRSPVAIPAVNAAKSHCKYGHPFDDVNTRWRPGGGRDCRACAKRHQADLQTRRTFRAAGIAVSA